MLTFSAITIDAVESKLANITDFPWMILVGIESESNNQCTGVIVAPRYAITSSHCAQDAQDMVWTIRSGSSNPRLDGTKHELERIIPYDNPNDDVYASFGGGLVLVSVKNPFVYGETRQPIPILDEKFPAKDSEAAYLISFGQLTSKDKPTDGLRVLPVKIGDASECGSWSANSTTTVCVYLQDFKHHFVKLVYDVVLIIDGTFAGIGSRNTGQFVPESITYTIFQRADMYQDWILKNIDDSGEASEDRFDDFFCNNEKYGFLLRGITYDTAR
ncbi:hypothetical protein QAD02_018773 [Eretmocerus hayati]|uniref:Uncharacterized protein n=1 Tax=Eretmocerus hayati TaxID=131215 RepID=A0ACC2PIY0_9HYME|nr:hypothetical protein QAD02_018773 [Eretmocerus hayati]